MPELFSTLVRTIYRLVIVAFYRLFVPIRISGWENIPAPDDGPLIIIANHFSVFDVPIMGYWLPQFPMFFASEELWENRILAPGLNAMSKDLIKLRRGVVDRQSLKKGLSHLENGGWLMIFPEGGVTPESIAKSSTGESTAGDEFGLVRDEPVLLPAKPGVALLATMSGAPILPIGIKNSNLILKNLRRFRRTQVLVTIGKPFKPQTKSEAKTGYEKRIEINDIGIQLMAEINRLI